MRRTPFYVTLVIALAGCKKPDSSTELTSASGVKETPIKAGPTTAVVEKPMPEYLVLTGTLRASQDRARSRRCRARRWSRTQRRKSKGLLKHARRFATRYEKTLRNYAAVVAIGCALLWLRL